ncbi:uncharacterized protein [Typha latifolia]|uniref:uncharacterized protein n=1 Tax=Typha latifolia TaxID=4733 RepID=UPI003C2D05D7
MGCSSSKLDDQEEVKMCQDRRNFTKQAFVQRNHFASWHILYLQSLQRVSFALCNYVDEYEHHRFLYPYKHLPSVPTKIFLSDIMIIPPKSFAPLINQYERSTSLTVNYLRSGGNPKVAKEEWPQSPETIRIESYYPTDHREVDVFFTAEVSTINQPLFSSHNGSKYLSPSPKASKWDFFWNPFSSMDGYGYPSVSSLDQSATDDDTEGIRKAREEEEIPELEDEDEDNQEDATVWPEELNANKESINITEPAEVDKKRGTSNEVNTLQLHTKKSLNRSEEQTKLQINNDRRTVGNAAVEQETPGFTVYANRRPTSMGEVMKDLETQFARICDSASEVSVLLEVRKAEEFATLPRGRMPNRAAFFGSSSTKFFQASTTRRNDGNESGTDNLEETFDIFKSHKATLHRLYEWEKKLYEEVKSGERVRRAYEKKCTQLKNHDLNGAEPSLVDKTRAAIRDLQTQLRISLSSVEYISKRIETLRDEELNPQIVELIQGLARMWRAMADSHRIQKRTMDEAKLLLFSSSFPAAAFARDAAAAPPRPSRAAASAVESELRNMRAALANWIGSQRAYAAALAGWIRRFAPPRVDGETSPAGEAGGGAAPPPVYETCVRWASVLESVDEKAAIEGLEFFAAGMAAVAAGRSRRRREAMEMDEEEDGERVVCAGTAVVVGALAELTGEMAEGYEGLVRGLEESGMSEEGEG